MSSLIPERPLLVFPSLASTIGLEEAVLLSLLDELSTYHQHQESRGYLWYDFSRETIQQHMPFWDDLDVQRVSQRLRDLGLILLLSAPYEQSGQLKFAFNEQAIQTIKGSDSTIQRGVIRTNTVAAQNTQTTPQAQATQRSPSNAATLLPPNWQPDKETLAMCSQLNIPSHFIREQLPEFVHYWRERGESQRTWGTKFIQHLKRRWTHHVAKNSHAVKLASDWQPSAELQQQIAAEGIPNSFTQKSLQ